MCYVICVCIMHSLNNDLNEHEEFVNENYPFLNPELLTHNWGKLSKNNALVDIFIQKDK